MKCLINHLLINLNDIYNYIIIYNLFINYTINNRLTNVSEEFHCLLAVKH